MMTQEQITRFLEEVKARGIEVNKTDEALLSCFRQWYLYDCMNTPVMEVKHGQA